MKTKALKTTRKATKTLAIATGITTFFLLIISMIALINGDTMTYSNIRLWDYLSVFAFFIFLFSDLKLIKKLEVQRFYEQEEIFLTREMREEHPLVMPADAERFPAWAKKKLDALKDDYERVITQLSARQKELLEILKKEGNSKTFLGKMELFLSTVDLLTRTITDVWDLPGLVSKEKTFALIKLLQTSTRTRQLKRNVLILSKKGYNLTKEKKSLDSIATGLEQFKKHFRTGDVDAPHGFLAYHDPFLHAGIIDQLNDVEGTVGLIHHRLFLDEAGTEDIIIRLNEAKSAWYGSFSHKYGRYRKENPAAAQEEEFLEPAEVDKNLDEATMRLLNTKRGTAPMLDIASLWKAKTEYGLALSLIEEVERNNDRVDLLPD